MKVVNKTHYFTYYNKYYNIVPDNNSWEFQSSRRLAYGQRLYWEYKYCKSVGGQAFFYTFTYNDDSLPHFTFERYDHELNDYVKISVPCFNYNHIRLITNGIISKVLRRKFGSQLRYFVACERGEGKGSRGKGMNPHYHVIFFIFPLSDNLRKVSDVPYKRISPIQFCHLCKCTWQYQSTYNKSDYVVADYKAAKFGHCQPGDDLGLITDFDALSYVTKYVCKDSAQCYDDASVRAYYLRYFREKGYTYHSLYSFYNYLRSNGSVIDKQHFMDYSCLNVYFGFRSLTGKRDISYFRFMELQPNTKDFDVFKSAFADYFKRLYLPAISDRYYRDYVNMYGSKVRTSKSLGIYGLNFVKDIASNPHFVLDKSNEVVTQPISLYYYRKIYMDVVRCPYTDNILYVLNERGIDLKCKKLPSVLQKTHSDLIECFNTFSNSVETSPLWQFAKSESLTYDTFSLILSDVNLKSVLYRYSVYRNVYQYRSYVSGFTPPALKDFSLDEILHDYEKFLTSNFYTCDYSETHLITLVSSSYLSADKLIDFSCHPCFVDYRQKFEFIEKYYDVYRRFLSVLKKKSFDDSLNLRKTLNAVKYSHLC